MSKDKPAPGPITRLTQLEKRVAELEEIVSKLEKPAHKPAKGE